MADMTDVDMDVWLSVPDDLQLAYWAGHVTLGQAVAAATTKKRRKVAVSDPRLEDRVYSYMVEVRAVMVRDVMVRFNISRKHARSKLLALHARGWIERVDTHLWRILPPLEGGT
jgi:predicted transcriptional regulator of viral defense system